MSADSLAMLRRGASNDLQKLASEHLQQDLQQSDRDTLKTAAGKISTHATIGSLVGLGIGAALAWRVRLNRIKFFEAFRALQRPTHVKFADGREEAIPDVTPLMQPTKLGDFATYTFFSIAGIFLGGEVGLLSGARSARNSITNNPETRKRIENAYRSFRIDVLKTEIAVLEKGEGEFGKGSWPMA